MLTCSGALRQSSSAKHTNTSQGALSFRKCIVLFSFAISSYRGERQRRGGVNEWVNKNNVSILNLWLRWVILNRTFSMSNPALSRFWTNLSLHCANCAFLRSDLLFSSVGTEVPSSLVTSLFPFPRRFLRERTSHTRTKSKPRSTMKGQKIKSGTDSGHPSLSSYHAYCWCCLPILVLPSLK